MLIKLMPNQVPNFWDAIKFAAVKANAIPDVVMQEYLSNLLVGLLDSRYLCFIRVSEQRELLAVAVVYTHVNKLTGDKSLEIECLYSFKAVDQSMWETDFKLFQEFAKKHGCKYVTAKTNNKRVVEIAKSLGFAVTSTNLLMEV